MLNHLALVSETNQLSTGEIMRVSAALGKQVARDFFPIWNIPATVNGFERLEDVPIGYWPIIVKEDIGFPGAAGIHLDDDGKPFGLVDLSAGWSLTASHEVLEMLGDPQGNTLRSAPSIHPDQPYDVDYLVEVCDPSEAWEFGYDINGVRVSDFYTPDYFLPFPSGNVRYSYTGAISEPRQVLEGGYLSWLDSSTGEWWQQVWFSGPQPQFRNLGIQEGSSDARSWLDEYSAVGRLDGSALRPEDHSAKRQAELYGKSRSTAGSKADRLRRNVDLVLSKSMNLRQ